MNVSQKSLFTLVLAAFAVGPALADGGHGHGRGGGEENGGHHGRGHDDVRVIEREHIAIVEPHHVVRACPPGLAKKHNGCLPPGHARRVVIGQHIPAGTVFVVPQPVLATLPPPPVGYRYAVVNNQVILVSRGDIVVDIIRSLVG